MFTTLIPMLVAVTKDSDAVGQLEVAPATHLHDPVGVSPRYGSKGQ
ncbi:hypothetical protein [Streptomyces sp. NPDC053079]